MASNELAAILARRRAKAGDAGAPVPAASPAPAAPAAPPAGPEPAKPTSSIAERIARLKAQSAAAAAAGEAAPAPVAIQLSRAGAESPGEAPGEAEGAPQRAASKIQQLQGGLGINVNPFGRPGGPRRAGTGGSSIMTTGEQYAQTHGTHGMGIAMPGMGAAIPMPGLAKAGTRIPGMASESGEPAPAPEVEHATMTRAAGPKRRGPTRGPPPGAFRIPGIPASAAPIEDPVEVSTAASAASTTPAVSSWRPPTTPTPAAPMYNAPVAEAAQVYSAPTGQPAPVVQTPAEPEPSSLFGGSSTATPAYSQPSGLFGASATAAPAYSQPPVQAAPVPVLRQPEPLPQPVEFKPPVAVDNDWKPTFAPPPSLFDNFSEEELTMGGLSISDVAEVKKASPYTPGESLFGVPTSQPSAAPVPTPASASTLKPDSPVSAPTVYAPVSTPAPVRAPAPVAAPAPAPVYTSAPAVVAPVPISPPVATAQPAKTASSSMLFGPATSNDDSSDSDWSDDEENTGKKPAPSLFGAPVPQTPAQAPAPTPSPQVAATPAPALVTPQAPVAYSVSSPDNGGLFGAASASSVAAPAPSQSSSLYSESSSRGLFGEAGTDSQPVSFAKAPERSSIAPPPRAGYSSLFAAAAESSSESDSDSDGEGGLFGTGLPTKR